MKEGESNGQEVRGRTADPCANPPPAPREWRGVLWLLLLGPLLWALHFLLSYVTAAIWCARLAGPEGSLDAVRLAIGAYTLLAFIGIGLTAWSGYRRAGLGGTAVPHDCDSAAARRQFLGFATLLLCLLSLVATAYVALGAAFIGSCR